MAEYRYQFRGVGLDQIDFGNWLKEYLAIRGPLALANQKLKAGGSAEQYKADVDIIVEYMRGTAGNAQRQNSAQVGLAQAAASELKTMKGAMTEEMKANARLRGIFFHENAVTQRLGADWTFKTAVSGMLTGTDRDTIAETVKAAIAALPPGTPYQEAVDRVFANAGGRIQSVLASNPNDNQLHRSAVAEGVSDAIAQALPPDTNDPNAALAFNTAASTHLWGPMAMPVEKDASGLYSVSAAMERDPDMQRMRQMEQSRPAEGYVSTKPISEVARDSVAAPAGQAAPTAPAPAQAPAQAQPAAAPATAPTPAAVAPAPAPVPATAPAAPTVPAAPPPPMYGGYTDERGVRIQDPYAVGSTMSGVSRESEALNRPLMEGALARLEAREKDRAAAAKKGAIAVDLRGTQPSPEQARFDRFAKAYAKSTKREQLDQVYGEIARLNTPDANMRREAAVTREDKVKASLLGADESIRGDYNSMGEKNAAMAKEWSKEWQGIQATIANQGLQPGDADAQKAVGEWVNSKATILAALRPEQRDAIMQGLTVDPGAHTALGTIVAAKTRVPDAPENAAASATLSMSIPKAVASGPKSSVSPVVQEFKDEVSADLRRRREESPEEALTGAGSAKAREALDVKTERRDGVPPPMSMKGPGDVRAATPTMRNAAASGNTTDYKFAPPKTPDVLSLGTQDLPMDKEQYTAAYGVYLSRVQKQNPDMAPDAQATLADTLTKDAIRKYRGKKGEQNADQP